ncbi:MAG: lipocalin family protein [Bacteroidota bacterium]|nr:lipocalin family protein [Bacteroidota bacterium]MDX5431410.1 lipocalin family protein [Bacteroidota bacterium]MDX5470138.1 lipocalin family protein [Bacteroidota bacterium]
MRKLALLMALFGLFSCNDANELTTVQELDLSKYQGVWHEIVRLPKSFEKNLDCVTATYTLLPSGKVEVVNRGRNTKDTSEWKSVKGSAKVPDSGKPGQLKVTFFWPFAGDYYVIDLAPDYRYALVGNPGRSYLWILSRNPQMPETEINLLLEKAKSLGFPVESIERINQSCFIE